MTDEIKWIVVRNNASRTWFVDKSDKRKIYEADKDFSVHGPNLDSRQAARDVARMMNSEEDEKDDD